MFLRWLHWRHCIEVLTNCCGTPHGTRYIMRHCIRKLRRRVSHTAPVRHIGRKMFLCRTRLVPRQCTRARLSAYERLLFFSYSTKNIGAPAVYRRDNIGSVAYVKPIDRFYSRVRANDGLNGVLARTGRVGRPVRSAVRRLWTNSKNEFIDDFGRRKRRQRVYQLMGT